MATVPTGRMERELRKLYLRWVRHLGPETPDLASEVESFRRRSTELIERLGGRAAALGALAGFPAPKLLELSPHVGTIYDAMQQAAISAALSVGLNAKDAARAMFRAGMDKSYRRLERLARTETTSAYWRNTWDSAAGLDLIMVWSVEDGPRTCEWCRERDGLVVDSPLTRDHPNGRCTLAPTLAKRVDYRGSIAPDGSIYFDPTWSARLSATPLVVPA